MSSNPFRLDITEIGEQWVVIRTTPHGKAVSQIPAPFRREILRGMLAGIEKALIRSHSPVSTRHAAPAGSSSCHSHAGETIWANEVRR